MKSYLLKLFGREEGPYEEVHVAQMFADGRIDRNTPCKPADRGEWKSVDDYLPMLKYGTQLPAPSQVSKMPPQPPPLPSVVGTTDFNRGFRYSVLVGSKDRVQMDGSGVHCRLLLHSSNLRSLADHLHRVRWAHWRCNVQFASSVSVETSARV
jgi:hypothetical protein